MNNKYLGVYSTVETSNTPSKRNSYNYGYKNSQTIRKRYWYAWEWDTGTVLVLNTDENYNPVGQPRILVYAVFDSRFTLEEGKTRTLPEPKIPNPESQPQDIEKPGSNKQRIQVSAPKVASTDSQANKSSPERKPPSYSGLDSEAGSPPASPEEAGARRNYSLEEIDLAEQDAVASFQDGLRLLKSGHRSEAMRDFELPLQLNAPWQRRHKHMFSNFGITLRKIKAGELALKYHQKALSLSPAEPNIMFNLARTYLILGNLPAAKSYIEFVLARNPNLKVGQLLKDYIDKNQ